jgi:hypothetical protein
MKGGIETAVNSQQQGTTPRQSVEGDEHYHSGDHKEVMVRRTVLAVLLVLGIALPAVAQVQYGSISGTIVDGQKLALPGVTITLSGPAMQGSRIAVSDSNGNFRFAPVPPGRNYTLKFELSGFAIVENTEIGVGIATDTPVAVEMSPSQIVETITVQADQEVIDTTKTTIDTTISYDFATALPNSRWYQTVMQMAPGVRAGNNPLVNGAANDGNQYLVDGVDTTDPRVQTWGTALNFDSVQEVQLQTAGFTAEYGRATGGIVNVVTKSGGNEFSFSARLQANRESWSANNGFDDERNRKKTGGSRTRENVPSITVGGPIVKDFLWFFVTYEGRDNSRGYTRYKTEQDYIDGNAVSGRTSYKGHYLSGKVSFQPTTSHNIVAMYNEDPIELSPLGAGWGTPNTAESAETLQFQGGGNYSVQWSGVMTDSLLLDAKYQMHKQELNVEPDGQSWADGVPKIYDQGTDYNYGAPADWYRSARDRSGLLLTGTYFLGTGTVSHQLKAGTEYLALRPEAGTVHNPAGSYLLDNHVPLYKDLYLNETGLKESKQDYYAIFVQDQWRLGKLTLLLGIRAESTKIYNNKGKELVSFGFGKQIAPRLGFAYDLNGDNLHGSIGRFYALATNYISDYFAVTTDRFQRWDWNESCDAAATDPWKQPESCWTKRYDFLLGASATIDKDLEPGYQDELTLGYDKRLSDIYSGGVSFVWREQPTTIDFYDPEQSGSYYVTNVPEAAKAYVGDKKVSEYQAVSLTVRKRETSDRLQFMANYTYVIKSRAWSTAWRNVWPGYFLDQESLNTLWYGESESPHNFKLYAAYSLPWKTSIGMNFNWNSGNVYTPYYYAEDGTYGQVPLERRGSYRVGNNWEGDLMIEQPVTFGRFEAAIYSNIWNVFNNQQPIGRGGYRDSTSTFKKPTGWQNPRQVEVGIRLRY